MANGRCERSRRNPSLRTLHHLSGVTTTSRLPVPTVANAAVALLSVDARFFVTFLYHHDVKNGVRTAVTITDAATWTVAASATGAYDGSAIATACGTAAELPAVLDAAAPATPVPPRSRSTVIHTRPVSRRTVTPSTIPGKPAVATDIRLIVCPSVKAINGMIIGS